MKMLRVCFLMMMLTLFAAACSKSMSSTEAVKKGYVVYGRMDVLNYELFEGFLDKVNSKDKAEVKFAIYTVEGDPIFHYLEYSNNKDTITYTYDSRQDENGKEEKVSTTCKAIKEVDGVYSLSDCDDAKIGQRFYATQKTE
ncbi:DUF4362 domain-containing protein [Paenibacillus tianjinensis]|uniref:DUF4362 domain-containing protein n=1 Tax=Paenibacillus tianjinensis TaxID=2810347 RepID=A0ABX7LGU2_9BACL|nr:DUF4362 domain-containing protein [Paenibacillus tianjinensis]QSF47315.1 DUF4362 domain-containing protein [Paenibacillus tianjinensis]